MSGVSSLSVARPRASVVSSMVRPSRERRVTVCPPRLAATTSSVEVSCTVSDTPFVASSVSTQATNKGKRVRRKTPFTCLFTKSIILLLILLIIY